MNTLQKIVLTIFIVIAAFLLYFYRKPAVQIIRTNNDDTVYFPCFGTVKLVERTADNHLVVAVFLSPLDIHYQYMPIRGTIRNIVHDDVGVYNLAFDMDKSILNEKMIYTIDTKHGTFLLYQIAGFLVRRIVTDLSIGNTYETGEQVGLIKFGSRVDLIIPNADQFVLDPKTIVGASVDPNTIIGHFA